MRIAVVGSGIAGLASAWLLSREHEVVLYEAADRLGGHTHTHEVEQDGRRYAIDSGFIVFNPGNYPLFTRMLAEVGAESQPTTMSFSVQSERSGLEYNTGNLPGLFCQKRNLVSPRFWSMLREIKRFYREAPMLLHGDDSGPDLGTWLAQGNYGESFIDEHLLPMVSALWSAPARSVLRFPARYLVRFMANHHMLQTSQRPPWRVVRGGSSSYVNALLARSPVQVRTSTVVTRVERLDSGGVNVHAGTGDDRFDQAVLACHSDQALALVAQPTTLEREILGAIHYQSNDTVLHTDARLLPRHPRAWAAWNAHVPRIDDGECSVSYCMNLLQSIQSPNPFVVTLNRTHAIDPARVLARMRYAHPVYTRESVAAQVRRHQINGVDRIWYAGAYWGWGFHEDGLRSAVEVAAQLGVRWN